MIDSFRGEYKWLSNFYVSEVEFDGAFYPSTEHAYQAAKLEKKHLRIEFQDPMMSCREARNRGQEVNIRSDWPAIKYMVMKVVVKHKFSKDELKRKLLATGDEFLKEGNMYHDNYWGSCYCSECKDSGLNNLGQILMEIRSNS